MTGTKTNERPGTRAQVRYARMSPYKAREVLDLIRGLPVDRADEVLQFTERAPAVAIRKVLASAVANAAHNDQVTDESVLYVSACFADEGPTLKRWRPRARGRATRIRKRTCHITLIVSVMEPAMLAKVEADRERANPRKSTTTTTRATTTTTATT
jgi:large subunit ribosomal protein L22